MLPSGWIPVASGGALGTLARIAISDMVGADTIIDPAMVTANLVGALLLGVLVGVASRREVTEATRQFFGPGLLASFTTYSALAVAIERHLVVGNVVGAVVAAGGTVAVGVFAAIVGLTLGKRCAAGSAAQRRRS